MGRACLGGNDNLFSAPVVPVPVVPVPVVPVPVVPVVVCIYTLYTENSYIRPKMDPI